MIFVFMTQLILAILCRTSDMFINNSKANIGGHFKTRDEVMTELARVLGSGCDISVEPQ